MTAREFVLQHYPDARAHRSPSCYGARNYHKYTYITATGPIGLRVHLADGKSESNAWVNAKKAIQQSPTT